MFGTGKEMYSWSRHPHDNKQITWQVWHFNLDPVTIEKYLGEEAKYVLNMRQL